MNLSPQANVPVCPVADRQTLWHSPERLLTSTHVPKGHDFINSMHLPENEEPPHPGSTTPNSKRMFSRMTTAPNVLILSPDTTTALSWHSMFLSRARLIAACLGIVAGIDKLARKQPCFSAALANYFQAECASYDSLTRPASLPPWDSPGPRLQMHSDCNSTACPC